MTGLLLAIVGSVIASSIGREPTIAVKIARVLLVVSGLRVAAQGLIPAELANGVADIGSPYTRGHFVSGLVTGAAWLLGALLLVAPMRRDAEWRGLYVIGILLVAPTIAASMTLRGVLDAGLAQRTGNAIFMVWYVLMSVNLIRLGKRSEVPAGDGRAPAV